ncbi:MAG: tetratricopeptide repeat protein [Thermomicrobiales bacterium]
MAESISRHVAGALPRPRTSLVGRDTEVSLLCDLVLRDTTSLVTLTGPGGVGKTRLALQAAIGLRPFFQDGVHLVELQTITESHLVTPIVAATFDIHEQLSGRLSDSLAAYLQPKRVLLLIDNCEHVIGACTQLADHLLRTCDDLRILATSREPLRMSGEQLWPVRPLSVPKRGESGSAASALTSDAVRLFVQRANAVAPSFAVSDANASSVTEICCQLDGIPLAIELAAARVAALTPQQIADRLGDRFRLLTSADRTATERHRTLRNVVEWSHELLDSDEQVLLRRMAVFAGGGTLEEIEEICGDQTDRSATLDLLTRLVDKSLVLVADDSGARRYSLLETVRLFALEQLVSSGAAEETYQRHADYFLRFAEAAGPELWSRASATWLDYLELDHDNFRAVLRWAIGHGHAETGQRLGAALYRFWVLRGHLTEGLHWLEGGLSWSSGTTDETRARALNAAGHLARALGRYEQAARFHEQSLALYHHLSNVRGAALALNNLGVIAQFQQEYARAAEYHQESLRLFRIANDPAGAAVALVTLGTMAKLRGDYEEAFRLCEESVAQFRHLGDHHGVASALSNLGNVAWASDQPERAAACYQEAVALFRELGDRRELAAALRNLATAARDDGDNHQARMQARESLQLYSDLGDSDGVLACMAILAEAFAKDAQDEIAVRLLGAIDAIRRQMDASAELSGGGDLAPLIATLRERLGSAAFDAVWESGQVLLPDDVVRLALSPLADPVSTDRVTLNVGGLSPRQCEVVQLITQGLSNKKIAETLFISERTADAHVEHILRKLGMHSRAQVAAWEMERRANPNSPSAVG